MPHANKFTAKIGAPKKSLIDEIRKKQIEAIAWEELDFGSFKEVSVTMRQDAPIIDPDGNNGPFKGPWVKKTVYNRNDLVDMSRQVRLFKAIEPDIPIRQDESSFFMPYYGDVEPNDAERAQKCLDIFKKSGRILIDGMVEDNILVQDDNTVCIDLDLAIRPDSPLSKSGFFSAPFVKKHKRKQWYPLLKEYLVLQEFEEEMPQTHHVLSGLIDLAEYYGEDKVPPKCLDLTFLGELADVRQSGRDIKTYLANLPSAPMEHKHPWEMAI